MVLSLQLAAEASRIRRPPDPERGDARSRGQQVQTVFDPSGFGCRIEIPLTNELHDPQARERTGLPEPIR
jgi:hypothetical protein